MSDPQQPAAAVGPYATAAPLYHRQGWAPLPLPYARKKPVPDGWTGNDGAWPSYADVQAWIDGQGAGNVALRLPPNVLGVDVDQYGSKPGGAVLARLEEQHGPLPPTWRSTSRDDGVSGIRLYRVPEGLRWPGILGPGIEVIRYAHRYAVAWPSVHPDTGGTYRWITPDGIVALNDVPAVDDLPAMPAAWVDALTGGALATDQQRADLTDAGAAEWLGARPAGPMCRHMTNALTRGLQDLTAAAADGSSRHDAALQLTNRLTWIAGEGHVGATEALTQTRNAFLAALSDARGRRDAEGEWDRMLAGAVRMAAAQHASAQPDPCADPYSRLRSLVPSASTTTGAAPWIQPSVSSEPSSRPPSSPSPASSSSSTTSGASAATATPSTTTATSAPWPAADASTTGTPAWPAETAEEQLDEPASWARVDLGPYLDGTYEPIRPTLFTRTDGVSLVYPGLVHSFHGESESGKSFVCQVEAAQLINAGHDVLFVDFESDPGAVTERLLMQGARPDALRAHFDYRSPDVNPNASAAELLAWTDMLRSRYALAVIDGVTDSLGVFGYATKENDDITAWMRVVPKNIARQTGAGVVIIDHVAKDTEGRGRYAIGGQAKMSGLTGAAYTVEIVEPMGRGLRGIVAIRVAKDRPGFVRGKSGPMRKADRTQESARVVIDSTGAGLAYTVEPPHGGGEVVEGQPKRPVFRLFGRMQEISERLEEAGGDVSQSQLEKLVSGRAESLREAAQALVKDGFVTITAGGRGAILYRSVKPYRQREDPSSALYRGTSEELSEMVGTGESSQTDRVPTPSHEDSSVEPLSDNKIYAGVPNSPIQGVANDPVPPRPTPSHPVPDAVPATPSGPPPPYGDGDGVSGGSDEVTPSRSTKPTENTARVVRRPIAGQMVLVDLDTGEILDDHSDGQAGGRR